MNWNLPRPGKHVSETRTRQRDGRYAEPIAGRLATAKSGVRGRLATATVVALFGPVLAIVTASPAQASVPYGTDYPLMACSAGVANVPPGTWHERTCTVGGEILAYYRIMLRRDPDPGGFSHFMMQYPGDEWNRMKHAAWAISASQEAGNVHGHNRSNMLDDLYQALLKRWPDAGGKASFMDFLARGYTWAWVVDQVLRSPEYNGKPWHIINNSSPRYDRETYHEADYYVGGDRYGRTEMHYLHFLSWRNHRTGADWPNDPLDWSDDGCSTPLNYNLQVVDQRTCLRHDFGYRNFGRGLYLEPLENRRHEIDDQLWWDMRWDCNNRNLPYTTLAFCLDTTDIVYTAVRGFGGWR